MCLCCAGTDSQYTDTMLNMTNNFNSEIFSEFYESQQEPFE